MQEFRCVWLQFSCSESYSIRRRPHLIDSLQQLAVCSPRQSISDHMHNKRTEFPLNKCSRIPQATSMLYVYHLSELSSPEMNPPLKTSEWLTRTLTEILAPDEYAGTRSSKAPEIEFIRFNIRIQNYKSIVLTNISFMSSPSLYGSVLVLSYP